MPQALNLYGYWRSSTSWRIRWALELKKIPFHYHPVNLLEGEHLQEAHLSRDPMGRVPVLKLPSGRYLSESLAILEWLEETYPRSGTALLPADLEKKAFARQLCETINSGIHPLQNMRVLKKVSEDTKLRSEWAAHWIRAGLKSFDQLLPETAGPYSLGTQVSAVDICLIPQIYASARHNVDISAEFPRLQKIYEFCIKTPECLKSSPETQIDAPKTY